MAFSSVRANRGTALTVKATVPRAAPRTSLIVEARAARAGVGLMGTKAGMTTVFQEDGSAVACTVIGFESANYITRVFTSDSDGYDAVQVGYKEVKEKNLKKPEVGHCKKAGVPPLRHLCEFKVKDAGQLEDMEVGQQIDMTKLFEKDQVVDVAGMTIGKGFQGSIKRWGHKRGPMSHGSKSHRQHGSIGQCATPGRVFPNLKHAGHMGYDRKTSRKLQVLLVDAERGAIVVKGSVPGKPGNLLEITPAKVVGKNC